MGMNFTIRNLEEWQQLNQSLSKAADYMAEAAEALRKAVIDNFAQMGISGDLTPIIMEKYDEEVNSVVKDFEDSFEMFINSNVSLQASAEDTKAQMAAAVDSMR